MAQKKISKNRNTKQANLPFLFRLPEVPVALARFLIFILVFANIGMAYLYFSQAATYNVRFVLFCATDSCSGSVSTLDGYRGSVRSWYGGKLGRTFTSLSTIKVTGSHNAAYYSGGSRSDTVKTWNNVYADLNAKGYINTYTKTVVQLGFRSMGNCGVGSYDGTLAISDPFKGCSSIQPSVLAHELGHTFKLAGTSDMHRYDGTLMNAPLACNGATLSNCALNSTDRSWLLNNRAYWFPNSTTTSTTTTTTTTSSPYVESSSDPYRSSCQTPTHQTLQAGNSGNCVKHLQWILVNKWPTHGGSYVSNSGGIDGGFGSGTTQAVKTFQAYKGLTADGVVGPKTWDALH